MEIVRETLDDGGWCGRGRTQRRVAVRIRIPVIHELRASLLSPQNAAIVVRTGLDTVAAANALRTTIHEVDPGQPVSSVTPMSQVVADSMAQPRLYTALLTIFGGLALVRAAAGIFSVLLDGESAVA
jgi:hypothetical protein